MPRRRHGGREQVDIWPGFVDAISTLLLSIIFLLIVFVLGQFFLGQALQGRNETVRRLQDQVRDLGVQLGGERDAAAELRRSIQRLGADLRQAAQERDDLAAELARATAERDRQAEQARAAVTDREGLRQALEEAQRTVGADRATVQAQLGELARLREQIDALTARRQELEAQAAQLAQAQGAAAAEKDKAQGQVRTLTEQIATLARQLGGLDQALSAKQEEIDKQSARIADLGQRLNTALASKVEELSGYRSEFFGKLRASLENRDDIRIVGDRFVFQSEVLFESGSADIRTQGQVQLAKLAITFREILGGIPGDLPWVLQVDGHTDRRPISSPRFPSNWELSTARAIAVARFLVTQGIPPDRVAARGFAEFQPLDQGDGEDAFRRNRRIEIKLTTR